MSQTLLTSLERRATWSLASIFSLRMLGLFMVLPIFSLYAHSLPGATAFTIGLAMGVYGLTQALLQLPLGMLSDYVNRKWVVAGGLIVFCVGSLLAGFATHLPGIIIGRALQGAGAVGSASLALLADLTAEAKRTAAMAIVGMSIGVSFAGAIVLGPILNQWVGVPGVFKISAALGGIALLILIIGVPKPIRSHFHRDTEPVLSQMGEILKHPELLRLNFGIFCLHALLTSSFVVIPVILQTAGLAEAKQWWVYLPSLVLGCGLMVPFIIVAEIKRQMKPVMLVAIALLIVSQWLLTITPGSVLMIALALLLLFTAFTLLEAMLPSLVSKWAPAASKGTAMGVNSSLQFLGIFVGGTLGGWLYGHHFLSMVFIANAGLCGVWLILSFQMHKPPHLTTRLQTIGPCSSATAASLSAELAQVPGVAEAVVIAAEGIAYLKVDSRSLDEFALQQVLKQFE